MTMELSEREWDELLNELLSKLPANADRPAVRAAVKAAVQEHKDNAHLDQVQHTVRRDIEEKAKLHLKKLRDSTRRFDPLSPSEAKAMLGHIEALEQKCSPAEIHAAGYLPTARRQRLLAWISRAWAVPGKGKLSISQTGPFVDFLSTVIKHVPAKLPISGRGVKAFVKRENRRKNLNISNITDRTVEPVWCGPIWSGKGSLGIVGEDGGEDGIFLIDASGQTKSK
jgi:hypothetical protein